MCGHPYPNHYRTPGPTACAEPRCQCAKYAAPGTVAVPAAELAALRAVYAAIRDGEATWAAALDHKTGKKDTKGEAEKAGKGLKAKLAEKVRADEPARDPGSDDA